MDDLAISRGGPISNATCHFDYKDLDAAERKGARDSQPNNARAYEISTRYFRDYADIR
jgi:hypothetical protein